MQTIDVRASELSNIKSSLDGLRKLSAHVEERFAFPLIPICLMAIVFKIKNLCETRATLTTRWFWIVFSFMMLALYIDQVLLWDHQQVVVST